MIDQQLKFDIITVLDLFILINGSDFDCGTQKVGFQIKKKAWVPNKKGNLSVTNHPL